MSGFTIKKAEKCDVMVVSEILTEAAEWLEEKGEKLWDAGNLSPDNVKGEVEAGLYRLAEIEGKIAGCFRYQQDDLEYWDDVPHEDSSFVHRVAVKRKFAGNGIPLAMIEWAKQKAKEQGKRYLRLDCADRPKLRAVYEKMGFVFHSLKERSPYIVIRYEFDLDKLD